MRTCYLHLGMPKTGSTSIQKALNKYEDDRLVYAKLSRPNHQAIVSSYFSKNPHKLPVFARHEIGSREMRFRLNEMKQEFEGALLGNKSVVFSGEGILYQLSADEIGDMIEFLKKCFDRVLCIIYVRPLASLAPSQFQQRVKLGLSRFEIPLPLYRERTEPLLRHMDRDDVVFIRFDRSDLVGGDVVRDFCSRVNISSTLETKIGVNEALSTEALGAMFAFNKYVAPFYRRRIRARMLKKMFGDFKSIGQTKFGLSSDLMSRHLDKCASDIMWMEEVCGFDVKGVVKTVPRPVGSEEELLKFAETFSLK